MNQILRCHETAEIEMVRADGCYLYDARDKKYVDLEAGVWCAVLGHNHPRINKAIKQQLTRITHLGYRYMSGIVEDASVALLESIRFTDGKCIFLCSGSEAVEFSLQVARLVTGRERLLVLSQSYLGAYGVSSRRDPNQWVPIDFSACLVCEDGKQCADCQHVKDVPFGEIAAFVLEPGSASGNVKFPPDKLVDFVVKEVKRHGGLLVVDEVTTGLGRTGKWYGFDHYGLRPDIVAFGKALGNGYPVSAVAMKKDVAAALEKREFRYVQSHQNDPMGCAVADEVIRVIEEEGLVERSAVLGNRFLGQLREMSNECGLVTEARGRGLMIAVEFAKAEGNSTATRAYREMLRRGFLIGYNPRSRVIRFLPPLTIGEKEIENVLENLRSVLQALI